MVDVFSEITKKSDSGCRCLNVKFMLTNMILKTQIMCPGVSQTLGAGSNGITYFGLFQGGLETTALELCQRTSQGLTYNFIRAYTV